MGQATLLRTLTLNLQWGLVFIKELKVGEVINLNKNNI